MDSQFYFFAFCLLSHQNILQILCHLSKSSSADYQRGVQQDIKYNGLVKNAYLTYLSSRYIVERPRFSCLAVAARFQKHLGSLSSGITGSN